MRQKLYVFAIGGSGERVLKSLAMMLAAGMPIEAQEVIPVLVDNDVNGAALKECEKLFELYGCDKEHDLGVNSMYQRALGESPSGWPSFCKTIVRKPVVLNVAGDQIGNLDRIINCPQPGGKNANDITNELIDALQQEKDLLFTKEDLEMPLTVGFVGNPNIGSVVLNSLSLSDVSFQSIYKNVNSGDGVIVVGSLFGGTGAAGFPLIINKFNKLSGTQKPMLGGVAVLPYFDTNKALQAGTDKLIDTEKWDVNSDTFPTKTRAALMYYDDYMTNVDYMYYTGDDKHRVYKHSPGGKNQANPANLVELLSALSIFDFAKQNPTSTVTYKRPTWGFSDEKNSISNVSGITNPDLKKALVKFQLLEILFKNDDFLKYAVNTLKSTFVSEINFTEEIRQSVVTDGDIKYNLATGLNGIFKAWDLWIEQLGDNEAPRMFKLFDNAKKTDRSNVTQNFFTENGAEGNFGIAKTYQKGGGFFGGKKVTVAIQPEILDEMDKVYKEKYQKIMAGKTQENQKLAYELLIISDALDNVIANKCAL